MSDAYPVRGGDWHPWEMEELVTPGQQRASHARPDPATLGRQAWRKGHLAGKTAGQKAGYAEGLVLGRDEGFKAGLEEGREEGRREMHETLAQALAPLKLLLANADQALQRLDDEIAADLVDLALAVGRQLAGDALDANPEQIVDTVRELLHEDLQLSLKPKLCLHPADLALVESALGADLQAAGWQTQSDDAITRGGCRVGSACGEVDATVEARWDSIRRQVRNRQHRRGES